MKYNHVFSNNTSMDMTYKEMFLSAPRLLLFPIFSLPASSSPRPPHSSPSPFFSQSSFFMASIFSTTLSFSFFFSHSSFFLYSKSSFLSPSLPVPPYTFIIIIIIIFLYFFLNTRGFVTVFTKKHYYTVLSQLNPVPSLRS
jgi:hypothetical protein